MAQSIAQNMVATLRANGVKRVYGVPGDSLNGFTDALRRDGTIEWIHVLAELRAMAAPGVTTQDIWKDHPEKVCAFLGEFASALATPSGRTSALRPQRSRRPRTRS